MQKRIWSKYNKELVQRGSITFLIEKKTLESIKSFKAKSTGGRPLKYPQALILLLLTVKIQYSLTYRALEGFARSVFEKMGKWFEIPTYSTICKRAKELASELPELTCKRPKVILIDASGVKVFGEGEWKRKIHGVGRPRKWMKLHIAVEEHTQEVVATALTDCRTADCAVVKKLLDELPNTVEVVKADGAYDRKAARKAIKEKNAKALIPPPRNARVRGIYKERDNSVLEILGLGGDKQGRSLWGKLTGYSYRVLVETAFSRFKRLFGDRLFSQTIERQLIENKLKWSILNKMRVTA